MIDRDWRTHSEFHTTLAQCATDWVRYMICGKPSSCYLIEQRQKSLKVMAIYNCDIGILSKRFGSG
mgnify:CR=1 FL=1